MKTKQCKICNTNFECIRDSKQTCSPSCQNKLVLLRRKQGHKLFYNIETVCKCGCGEIILNPDNHYRYRNFIKAHINRKENHPRFGVKESDEHLKMRVRAIQVHFREKKPTCIEIELYEYLERLGVVFEKQKQIGRYIPDAYIPSKNLCIFADGFYWHSKPEAIDRDSRCNTYLESKGYSVIRLPSKGNGYHLDLSSLVM